MAKASIPKRPTRDEFELEEVGAQLIEAKEDVIAIRIGR